MVEILGVVGYLSDFKTILGVIEFRSWYESDSFSSLTVRDERDVF